MTTANGTNHRIARKSLADQLDKLDGILDGLAEAIPETIADAVRAAVSVAVGEAVKTAVAEVLSNPTLLQAALQQHTPPQPAPEPPTPQPKKAILKKKLAGAFSWLGEKVAHVVSLARKKLSEVRTSASQAASQVTQVLAAVPSIARTVAQLVWAYRKPGVVAVGAGLTCGAACYLGGPLFASLANGLGGAAVTLSALTLPLRRRFAAGNS